MRIGTTIRVVRRLKKMTQLELAEKAGLTNSSLSLIENNYRRASWDMIEKISSALNIRPLVLFALTEIDIDQKGE